jgi:long-chain acyl-CoA synthetase
MERRRRFPRRESDAGPSPGIDQGLHPAFGVPDLENPGSERVMAVVVLKEGYLGSVTEQEVREFCRQHLPPYAVPKIVEFRDELPLTVSEKVFKKVMRDQAIARMRVQKEG